MGAQHRDKTIAKFGGRSWFLVRDFCNYFLGERLTDVVVEPHSKLLIWDGYLSCLRDDEKINEVFKSLKTV